MFACVRLDADRRDDGVGHHPTLGDNAALTVAQANPAPFSDCAARLIGVHGAILSPAADTTRAITHARGRRATRPLRMPTLRTLRSGRAARASRRRQPDVAGWSAAAPVPAPRSRARRG